MFKEYQPIEYLCIDIANNFGNDGDFRGDKDTFENRIQWVKDNYSHLEQRSHEAEEPELFVKGVMALRNVEKGNKTGIAISLDSTCSG